MSLAGDRAERRAFEENRQLAEDITHRLDDLAEREQSAKSSAEVFDRVGLTGMSSEREYRGGDLTREAIRTVENMRVASDDAKHALVGLIEEDDSPNSSMARWAYVTSNEDYRTAFGKLLRDPERGHLGFTPEEGRAFTDAQDLQRAMAYGTNTSGRFLVPSFLDPAIYLTNGGANSPIPKLARQVTIATHDWNGVTSDGVTMSWDAEWSEVSDDSPTLASVNIPTYKAAGLSARRSSSPRTATSPSRSRPCSPMPVIVSRLRRSTPATARPRRPVSGPRSMPTAHSGS